MSEWIKWAGGKQPVPNNTKVDVLLRNGNEGKSMWSHHLYWSHSHTMTPDSQIVAYRLAESKLVDIVERNVETGKPVSDSEGGVCNVCGEGVRYGSRHRACGTAVMKLEADLAAAQAENKQLMEMPFFREYQHALHRAKTAETELVLLKKVIEPFQYAAGEIVKALAKETHSPDAATEIRAEVTDETDVAIRTAAGLHPRSPMMARIETNFSLDSLELRHWAALHHATKEHSS